MSTTHNHRGGLAVEIGIIGAGNIGGNAARRFALGGHTVVLSYSRDPANLDALAGEIGDKARVDTRQGRPCAVW